MSIRPFATTLVLCFALAACGGDSPTEPDSSDSGPGGGDTRSIKADPSFANDIQEIFNRRGCSSGSCHGSAQSAGMDLRTGSAFANIVNVAATSESGKIRVIPGDANGSYIVIKLEGRQSVGQQMPRGGAPLDNIDLTNIKNWINQGAKNN